MVRSRIRNSLVAAATLVVLVNARPVAAGPPLLCHPFDISGSQSLPWGSDTSWSAERADYDVSRLVQDTEKLLVPATPVIVRMEILRRAAIYASRDRNVAASLLSALTRKVHASNATGAADPLAYLDAGYMIEALQQIGMFGPSSPFGERAAAMREVVRDLDGYELVRKALAVRPNDPSLEFAAALIASQRHRAAYQAHAERARAGAGKDPLLAKNLKQLT